MCIVYVHIYKMCSINLPLFLKKFKAFHHYAHGVRARVLKKLQVLSNNPFPLKSTHVCMLVLLFDCFLTKLSQGSPSFDAFSTTS